MKGRKLKPFQQSGYYGDVDVCHDWCGVMRKNPKERGKQDGPRSGVRFID